MAKKCSIEGMCNGLNAVYDDAGIRTHVIYDMRTEHPTPEKWMVAIHAGKHKKPGLVMNFCPFCGQKLGVMSYAKKKISKTKKAKRPK